MTHEFKTKHEAIVNGAAMKDTLRKNFKNAVVWIEKENGMFKLFHSLAGKVSKTYKQQHII